MRLDAPLQVPLEEILRTGLGIKSWSHDPNMGSGGTAPTAGTVYARALALRKGQSISNLLFQVTTGGAGTVPTSITCGLADSTGKIVALSGELKASAIWTPAAGSGLAVAPLTASYTAPADGLYYVVFLQVGAWGTTQMVLGKGVNNVAPGGIGTTVFGTGGTTGQAALPAVASSIVGGIVTTNGIDYFVGAS
jgi:hypothetical protein